MAISTMKKTSDLCDACAEIVVCKIPLRSFGQIRSFYGEIKTVQCDGDITKMREAVNLPGRGMVLVVDNAGILEHAVFGDVMAGLAIQNEWAGLIIYGAIRDVAIIDAMPIGVKALGAIPCRGTRLGIGKANIPVSFGGVSFSPGCFVVADEDGVVLLPAGITPESIATEEAIRETYSFAAQK